MFIMAPWAMGVFYGVVHRSDAIASNRAPPIARGKDSASGWSSTAKRADLVVFSPMPPRTVLIVDDDADIREIVQFALELDPDWKVVGEAEGERAVDRAVETRPDVILLDVNLAGMDGPATLAALRADSRTAGIPVLFLTANTRPADVERLRDLGATGVLAKPFDPLSLGIQVRREMRWTE